MPRFGLLVVLGLGLLADVAEAQGMRVAVERFRGPQSGSVRNALVSNLQDAGIEVVPDDDVRAKSRELFGRTRLRDDDYAQVAQALGITAFVDGRVTRQRRRWALRVRVRNGADGMVLGTARWGGRTVGSLRAVRRNGHDKLAQYLSLATSPAPPQPVAPQPAPVDPNASPWYGTAEPDTPVEEPEEPEEPRARPAHDGVRIGFLVGVLKRSMSEPVQVDPMFRMGSPPDLPVAELREYNSGGLGHLELGVNVELFPGALLEDPALEWLGVAFSFRNSVLLETNGPACDPAFEPIDAPPRCPTGGGTVPIDSTQRELYIGAKVEYGFGGTAGGPWINVDFGYGRFLFDLDVNDLVLLDRPTIVPPLDYAYLHVGGGLKLGLHDMVLLGARFGYRQGFGVGDPARRIWGVSTSGFRGWQVGADLIHRMRWASDNVYLTLSVEYFRFTTEFSGPPACREPGPDDACNAGALWEPWWQEDQGFLGPVEDSYLRLGLQLGYVY